MARVTVEAWPCDPNEVKPHAGEPPFRIRGIAYSNLLERGAEGLPGGAAAFLQLLPRETAEFLRSTIFLASATYDVVPFVRALTVAAEIARLPLSKFVRDRSRTTAERDVTGMYRAQMRGATASEMSARMPRMFARYFEPSSATILGSSAAGQVVRFSQLPAGIVGFYAWNVEGFVEGALASTPEGKHIGFDWSAPVEDTLIAGVPTVSAECRMSW
ncbi:MAG: hypothetical protein U0271_23845 [Polyangiaceae bacterium]